MIIIRSIRIDIVAKTMETEILIRIGIDFMRQALIHEFREVQFICAPNVTGITFKHRVYINSVRIFIKCSIKVRPLHHTQRQNDFTTCDI